MTNRDGGRTNEEGHIRFQTKVWSGNVAVGLQAVQRSPLAMGINVSIGDAKVDYSTYSYTVWTDAVVLVATATADPSNPRIDRIVGYVDRSMTPSSATTNNPGLLKFMSIAGTPSASPARPSNTTVQAAVGASNPYFDIANVLVGTGVTQITTANITDTRVMVTVGSINGIGASATPVANKLLALDANARISSSILDFNTSAVIKSLVIGDVTTTSTTPVDMANMLTPTIIVPASGKVIITGSIFFIVTSSSIGDIFGRVSIGGVMSRTFSFRPVAIYNGANIAVFDVMTGLTPGPTIAKIQWWTTSGVTAQSPLTMTCVLVIPVGA